HLGYLFSIAATLARQLDVLKNTLPKEIALKGALQNLITSQLSAGFGRLIAYYKADLLLLAPARLVADVQPDLVILGSTTVGFSEVYATGLSKEWITGSAADWPAYKTAVPADNSVYGLGASVFDKVNHIATHNLFTSIFDQFLKVYARVVADAKLALEDTFTQWDRHEPHYALFLAFLRLQEYTRQETNTLTKRHLDFYYRDILRLREKPAEPGHAHLLLELAKHVESHLLEHNELFKAGKDDLGKDVFFANDREFVANQAKVTALKTVYRHGSEIVGTTAPTTAHEGRIYASPVANSDDGLNSILTSVDQSWHPFFNKIYIDGELTEIRMPQAEVGFAIASHYLLMAEGKREVTLNFTVSGYSGVIGIEWNTAIRCSFSGEKAWIDKTPASFQATSGSNFRIVLSLAGDEPAVVAYDKKVHGYDLAVTTPVMLVKLVHNPASSFAFPLFENTQIQQIQLQVNVDEVKNLLLSNDFGPVDASKPFQPFGSQPEAGSSLILSSQEIFQKKNLATCEVTIRWKNIPDIASVAYLPSEQDYPEAVYDWYTKAVPWINVTWLKEGKWDSLISQMLFDGNNDVTINLKPPVGEFNKQDQPQFQIDAPYSIQAKTGYVRLALPWGLGHKQYREALADYFIAIAKNGTPVKPTEPYTPEIEAISVRYVAVQTIRFDTANKKVFDNRETRFFHLAPFGQAEQHPYLKTETKAPDTAIYLLAQLKHLNTADDKLPKGYAVSHEAEFYVGITGLLPPQNLALLFQVADGTADPLAQKPVPHIHWSYLHGNEWIEFSKDAVEDQTKGLINSGIVTFAMPREATATNTLLPTGIHWIRLAVAEESAAVCRLLTVAAQALRATFTNQANDPAFPAKVLATGTISKLDQPSAAVKKVVQPFDSFGGRGQEASDDFYTRVSERLRHKDRAITLWDYEHLVLEAFPQIYKVKCLNHTHYEPKEGIYKELAPGHVSLVTIPNQQFHNLRDPLRPYTSLGLLKDIEDFLKKRLSCFVKLHVKNPQFEEVRVSFKVRLYEGFDETFYTNKLKEAITRFLSPWAFPGGGSPSFGGKIYKSVLINFVEEQPYVDYLTDFQLFHSETGNSDRQEIEGSKAVSILVSVPAKKHEITPIQPAEEETPHEKCPCEA
ncbi:MAG: baseplate J/gp47 family protein, partial [Bacteroidota bacterium]